MSPLWQRLRGFDVDVDVVDGHDVSAIRAALLSGSERLKVIVLRTVKGRGVSFMENEMKWHYLALTPELYQQAIDEIGGK